MKKICVVVASRANYARIKSFLQAVVDHPNLELQLVVSASALLYRAGNAVDFIEKDGFYITRRVYTMVEGGGTTPMAKSTGLGIIEMSSIFDELKPDYVVTIADRFETLSTAVAASYMNIPLVHTQGGEITGSIDESVRHAITQLAHIHFPATEASAYRLIKMGQSPDTVYNVGCPAMDIIPKDLSFPTGIFTRCGGIGCLDEYAPYLVVSQHPVTTIWEQAYSDMIKTLTAVNSMNMQVFLLWPNVDAGSDGTSKAIRMFRENNDTSRWQFVRNISPEDYALLINYCSCLVGNSSSGIREGSFLGVPAVNVGNRQDGREHGENIIYSPHDSLAIQAAIASQVKHGKYQPSNLFGDGTAGKKMANILATREKPNIQKKLCL